MSAESARQSDMTYFDVSFLIFLLQIVELPLGKLQRPLRYIWADVCVMEPQVPVQSWHAPPSRSVVLRPSFELQSYHHYTLGYYILIEIVSPLFLLLSVTTLPRYTS